MPSIKLVTDSSNSVLAVPFLDAGLALPTGMAALPEDLIAQFAAKSKSGNLARVPHAGLALLAIGVGPELNLRDFGAAAARVGESISVYAPMSTEAELFQLVEGLMLGGPTPTDYKAPTPDLSFEVVVSAALAATDISAQVAVSEIIIATRQLINAPANDLYPESLAAKAKELVSSLPVEVEIWDENKLAQENCGGILSVGKGSVRPPRLVKLSYRGGGKHLALVGKGITFDTGGLSLKPAESMVGMKYDMAGSASVMAVVAAVARLGLKVNVTGYMCLAENMPSGTATRPGDVIRIRGGKSVEVLNTDAEGRLVLADGLTLAVESDADHIVDIATLTGAATIALGNRYAGVMGYGPAVDLTLSGASAAGELLWPMPLPQELRTILDSDLADIANVKIGNRAGGMLVGGQFLAEFVPKDRSWAHLDIAGPANNDAAPYGVTPKGASGVMIRSLIEVARGLAQ